MLRKRILYSVVGLLLCCSIVLVSGMVLYAMQGPVITSPYDDLLQWEAETLLNDSSYSQQLIRTGPAEVLYNCHGFTFAQGKRSVDDDEVLKLLKSSTYRKVTIPQAGDIVVYYDQYKALCHSGIVKATGKQGFVLVESKWGEAGRFLHVVSLPQVASSHEYYRTGSISRTNRR